MDNDFGTDLITLLDDDGNQHEFELLDEVEYEDDIYYALSPTKNNKFITADSGYYIFKVVEIDGEEQLEEVDEELANILDEIFEERAEAFYDEDEEGTDEE